MDKHPATMNSANGWTYKAIISILIVSHHHLEELHLLDYLMCTGNFCRRVILTATVRGRFRGGKGESAPFKNLYLHITATMYKEHENFIQ